jgi:hypothetical protein
VTLDEHSVLGYLADRSVLDHGPASAKALTGGVSNVVLLVETPERRVVLKQALPRLRVADEWYADPARTEAERRPGQDRRQVSHGSTGCLGSGGTCHPLVLVGSDAVRP